MVISLNRHPGGKDRKLELRKEYFLNLGEEQNLRLKFIDFSIVWHMFMSHN